MKVKQALAALGGAFGGGALAGDARGCDPGTAGWVRSLAASCPDPTRRPASLERWRRLLEGFRARFGDRDVLLARAPGRVNLIGEHTDYNGLPVLPLAVDRDIAAVFAPRADARVAVESLQPGFTARAFALERPIPPYPTGDWGNYVKAGVQGMLDSPAMQRRGGPAAAAALQAPAGFDALLDGDIPQAAGLSSSSALVVLSALVFLAANGIGVDRGDGAPGGPAVPGLQLAEWLARAEHYVGTQGGGMDQAISLLGRSGHALKIDFFPLRITPVPLPAGCVFVVADSTVRAAKTEGALDRYNRRAIECRLAAAVLARLMSVPPAAQVRRLGDLVRVLRTGAPAGAPAAELLHEAPYTLEEIARLLGSSPQETAERFCRRRDGSVHPPPPEGFKLRPRTRHVLEEGRRVEEALAALQGGDLAAAGLLMDRSHESCRDLYEISCPELDRLVEVARAAGALGARLTGAGFGGCTISLVREGDVPAFTEGVGREYYRDFLGLSAAAAAGRIFPCRAVDGAAVVALAPGGAGA